MIDETVGQIVAAAAPGIGSSVSTDRFRGFSLHNAHPLRHRSLEGDGQIVTAVKRIRTDLRYGGGNGDSGETVAVIERIAADSGNGIRDRDGFQGGTALESLRHNAFHSLRKHHIGRSFVHRGPKQHILSGVAEVSLQESAIPANIVIPVCTPVLGCRFCRAIDLQGGGTVNKRFHTYIAIHPSDTCRNMDSCQSGTAGESANAQRSNSLRDDHIRQVCAAGEGAAGNEGNPLRNFNNGHSFVQLAPILDFLTGTTVENRPVIGIPVLHPAEGRFLNLAQNIHICGHIVEASGIDGGDTGGNKDPFQAIAAVKGTGLNPGDRGRDLIGTRHGTGHPEQVGHILVEQNTEIVRGIAAAELIHTVAEYIIAAIEGGINDVGDTGGNGYHQQSCAAFKGVGGNGLNTLRDGDIRQSGTARERIGPNDLDRFRDHHGSKVSSPVESAIRNTGNALGEDHRGAGNIQLAPLFIFLPGVAPLDGGSVIPVFFPFFALHQRFAVKGHAAAVEGRMAGGSTDDGAYAGGNEQMLQATAAVEGIAVDNRHAVCNGDIAQGCAVVECLHGNQGNALGNHHRGSRFVQLRPVGVIRPVTAEGGGQHHTVGLVVPIAAPATGSGCHIAVNLQIVRAAEEGAACIGRSPDGGDRLGDIDMLKAGTAGKRIGIDGGNGVRQFQRTQGVPALKGLRGNLKDAFRNHNFRLGLVHRGPVVKISSGDVPGGDHRSTIGAEARIIVPVAAPGAGFGCRLAVNHQILRHIREGTFLLRRTFYGRYCGGNIQVLQRRPAGEGIAADGGDAGRQNQNGHRAAAALKGIAADGSNALRQRDLFNLLPQGIPGRTAGRIVRHLPFSENPQGVVQNHVSQVAAAAAKIPEGAVGADGLFHLMAHEPPLVGGCAIDSLCITAAQKGICADSGNTSGNRNRFQPGHAVE